MRTTVELKDEQRAALLRIAAARGEKGFSTVLSEAVDVYLRAVEDRSHRQQSALALRGTISDEQAEHMRHVVQDLRDSWR
jgi:hypothetical protein